MTEPRPCRRTATYRAGFLHAPNGTAAFLRNASIVDPADEYYDDYYAVFFLDPDGLKLEGMKYGEKHEGRKRASKVKTLAHYSASKAGGESSGKQVGSARWGLT